MHFSVHVPVFATIFYQSHISYAILVLQPRLKLLSKKERLKIPGPHLPVLSSAAPSNVGSVTYLPQQGHYSSILLKLLDFQFHYFVVHTSNVCL